MNRVLNDLPAVSLRSRRRSAKTDLRSAAPARTIKSKRGSASDVAPDNRSQLQLRTHDVLRREIAFTLDDRDRRIVMLRFGIDQEDGPQTLQTIGQDLGLSKERIRQLEIRAIAKLKQHVEGNP